MLWDWVLSLLGWRLVFLGCRFSSDDRVSGWKDVDWTYDVGVVDYSSKAQVRQYWCNPRRLTEWHVSLHMDERLNNPFHAASSALTHLADHAVNSSSEPVQLCLTSSTARFASSQHLSRASLASSSSRS